MRFIELHDHSGEPIALEPGMITMVQAAEQDKHPTRRAVLHLRNNEMRAIRESYAEVMALLQGTATAEQATAERADLDERLASLEADNKELHKLLGQCLGKAEQADGKANVAVDALFGDVDASIKALQASTARLEDELIAIRQNQEWRPAEGEGEPVVKVPCKDCDGLGTQKWQSGVVGGVKEEITVACGTCHGSGRVPA